MGDNSELLDTILSRAGLGYALVNSRLQIIEANETAARFGRQGRGGLALAGQPLAIPFPEFKDYESRLDQLIGAPEEELRFRIRRDNNLFAMVTVRAVSHELASLLIVFEDITLLVLRTEVLGRRVKELESRCQSLEKALFGGVAASRKTAALEPQFDTDSGLYTLDYVIGRMVEEEGLSRRWHRPCSIAVLRIDDMSGLISRKELSQQDTRDLVRAVAEVIRRNLRTTDTPGRLDDTGFVLLFPQTADDGAQVCAGRIAHVVSEQRYQNVGALALRVGTTELGTTREDTALRMLERAKQAAG
jgi:GGDEF domain-containing protein